MILLADNKLIRDDCVTHIELRVFCVSSNDRKFDITCLVCFGISCMWVRRTVLRILSSNTVFFFTGNTPCIMHESCEKRRARPHKILFFCPKQHNNNNNRKRLRGERERQSNKICEFMMHSDLTQTLGKCPMIYSTFERQAISILTLFFSYYLLPPLHVFLSRFPCCLYDSHFKKLGRKRKTCFWNWQLDMTPLATGWKHVSASSDAWSPPLFQNACWRIKKKKVSKWSNLIFPTISFRQTWWLFPPESPHQLGKKWSRKRCDHIAAEHQISNQLSSGKMTLFTHKTEPNWKLKPQTFVERRIASPLNSKERW